MKPLKKTFLLITIFLSFTILFAQYNPNSENDEYTNLKLICAGMGFQNGYLDGYDLGYNDSKQGYESIYQDNELYKNATRGYKTEWVFKTIYKRAYRQGFKKGYYDGYNHRENVVVNYFSNLDEIVKREARDRYKRETSPTRRTHLKIVVPEGTRILAKLQDYISTAANERGDSFKAVVTEDVFVGEKVAIPQGTIIEGVIGKVKRPGRIKGRAELSFRFDRLRLKNGEVIPISATLTGIGGEGKMKNDEGTFEGPGTKGHDAKVVAGTAAAGTVIGAIAAGGKGGLIGATIGGLAGLAGVLSTRGKDIELPAGTIVEISLDRPITIERYDVK